MTWCLHELSLNQEIQDEARKNVMEVLERHGGKITYESLGEMIYLEQCINGESFLIAQFPIYVSNFNRVHEKVPTRSESDKNGDQGLRGS